MKNLWLVIIIIMSTTVWAQEDKYLKQLKEKRANAISVTPRFKNLSSPSNFNKISTDRSGVEDLTCKEPQRSIPLSYLSGMLMNAGENYKLNYDKDRQTLKFDFGEMMTGCRDKYDFVKNSTDPKKYYIELRLKDGVTFEDFQKCTAKAEYKTERVIITFKDVKPNQEIVFLSSGPYASKYQRHKLINIDGCQVTEQIDNRKIIALEEDAEYLRKQQKAAAICESGNLDEIMGNLPLLEELGINVQKITDGLYDQKVIEASDKIRNKDLSDMDFSIFSNFEKNVIDPKIEEIEKVFSKLILLEVNDPLYDETYRKLDELKIDLEKYSRAPYPGSKVRSVLLSEGYFSHEALIFKINTKIAAARTIYNKKNGQIINPAAAQEDLNARVANHNAFLDQSRKEYRIRKGDITGESDKYYNIASSYQKQLDQETANYKEGMTFLTQKMQECAQQSMNLSNSFNNQFYQNGNSKVQECIESKQKFMAQFQKIYTANRDGLQEEIDTYSEQGDHYAALEAEGRGEVPRKTDKVEPSEQKPKYQYDYAAMLAENMPEQTNTQQNQQYQQYQQYQQGQQTQSRFTQGQQMTVSPQYQNPNQYNSRFSYPSYTGQNYTQNPYNQYNTQLNYNNMTRQPATYNQYQQNPLYNSQVNGNYYNQYHQYNQSIPSQMYNGSTTGYTNGANYNTYGLPTSYYNSQIRNF